MSSVEKKEKKSKYIGPPFARENEITFGISFSNPQAAPNQQQGCKSILFWFVLCQMEQVNKEQLEQIISTEIAALFFFFSYLIYAFFQFSIKKIAEVQKCISSLFSFLFFFNSITFHLRYSL